ncbi:MAG: hypothetical protein CMO82_01985 [Winogradskyella sp.]|uniref:Glycosyltransferase family 4 protein n=1 Tax=Winogradskyella poriferorum TaxID=307627 RepID=A0ABU7W424_9FLAO|nr:hypothetical protein [Winogradskyella sp.]|tara:strand:- start:3582 stop:4667 length:1086 start_codon:yes stop_codon:yes gene_type:complete
MKILLIGPLPNPTTGVSLANKVVYDGLKKRKNYRIDAINTSYNKFEEDLGAFSISKAWFFLKLNFFSYKIFRFDVVYITPGQTFFGVLKYALFILLAKLLSKEIIIHVHGNYLGKEYHLLKGAKKKIFKALVSTVSKGVVLSESLRSNMLPFTNEENIYVLYNFVQDNNFINKHAFSKKLLDNELKIIFLSNLMEEKGIFDLLEALLILEKNNINYEAKIAGNIDAKHKERVDKYFNELSNTKYLGVVYGKNKKDLLEWGNVFILPTYYIMEGQPISILEGMASGNLIVTTKHAGIPDIFTESENGFYVEKRNPQSIANTLIQVLENPELSKRIRTNNLEIAKSKYKVHHFIDNFIDILES